jgi:holliday junction DNA helicase RuvA
MIAILTGNVETKNALSLIIEIGGIGYEVLVSSLDYENIPLNSVTKLYIHEHIREDAHTLYGFLYEESKLLFEKLISVSGVGPKVGIAILSTINTAKLKTAISTGQSSTLQSVPGVGKKVAGRIVVELNNSLSGIDTESIVVAQEDSVYVALKQLGYSAQIANKAISELPSGLKTDEERIKRALNYLSRN